MTLDRQPLGKRVRVSAVGGEDAVSLRLLEMGLLPDTEVSVVRRAPLGDPLEIEVLGYRLLLRRSEASCVAVRDLP